MTPAEKIAALREMIGDEALHRLSGLDRRTIQRIAAGDASLHAETAARIKSGLRDITRLAGAIGPSALEIVQQVAAATPGGGKIYYLVAALLQDHGKPMTLRDICIAISDDPDASAPNAAVRALAAAGLVKIEAAGHHHLAKQATWIGR
jgi:hypothetical protein